MKKPNIIESFRQMGVNSLQEAISEFAKANNVQPISVSAYKDERAHYTDHCALVVFEHLEPSE